MMTRPNQSQPEPASPLGMRLTEPDFELFRRLIGDYCGIEIADSKLMLLQNRIGKRVRALGMTSFRRYYRYLKTPEGQRQELRNLWSVVTTNETRFFREPQHFEVLREHLLPSLRAVRTRRYRLRVWSAACSTGQEVYTLAMVLSEMTAGQADWSFSIIGTDIDYQALAVAEAGEYPTTLIHQVPATYRRRYLDEAGEQFRIKPDLRRLVRFRHQNLAEVAALRPRVDLIFCRNAIMYFRKETRLRLARIFRDSLGDGGYLLLGSAESLHGTPRLFESQRFGRTLVYQRVPSPELDRG